MLSIEEKHTFDAVGSSVLSKVFQVRIFYPPHCGFVVGVFLLHWVLRGEVGAIHFDECFGGVL